MACPGSPARPQRRARAGEVSTGAEAEAAAEAEAVAEAERKGEAASPLRCPLALCADLPGVALVDLHEPGEAGLVQAARAAVQLAAQQHLLGPPHGGAHLRS